MVHFAREILGTLAGTLTSWIRHCYRSLIRAMFYIHEKLVDNVALFNTFFILFLFFCQMNFPAKYTIYVLGSCRNHMRCAYNEIVDFENEGCYVKVNQIVLRAVNECLNFGKNIGQQMYGNNFSQRASS